MKQNLIFFALLLPFCIHAQFFEPFSGNNLTSNNPWEGAINECSIKENKLFFDGSHKSGNYQIYVPIKYGKEMQWDFDIKFEYKPNNYNYIRFYVYANDKPNQKIFYISLGGKNTHNISFRELKEKNSTLINGRSIFSDKKWVHIKLTLEKGNIWKLYTQKEDENELVFEGKYIMDTLDNIRDEGKLNISYFCKAKTLTYMFNYFDNIRVLPYLETNKDNINPENPINEEDKTPPSLINMEKQTNTKLALTYNEAVDISHATITLNEIGKAQLNYASLEKTIIEATFSKPLESDKTYTLSCSGITDMKGNKAKDTDWDIKWTEEKDQSNNNNGEAIKGSIIINEIMANPKGLTQLPETEYIELYNTTNKTIHLTNWIFIYGSKEINLPNQDLSPETYAILYRSGRSIKLNNAIDMGFDKFPYALANTGKLLQLKDSKNNLIDKISYPKTEEGKSWERDGSNLYLCTDTEGGTPGKQNSKKGGEDIPDEPQDEDNPITDKTTVEPNNIVFNEILPDPFFNGSEYIELYNQTHKSLPLKDLVIARRKKDGTLSTKYPLENIGAINADNYIVLTKDITGVTNNYLIKNRSTIKKLNIPILANSLSTIVLYNTKTSKVIDELSYTSKWHHYSIKDTKGVALERIDPAKSTQDITNWTSASQSAGFGTPGYLNSQSSCYDHPTGIQTPEYNMTTRDYTIRYILDHPGYNCRIKIFNTAGRCVTELSKNDLLGTKGEIKWDGLNRNKTLPSGVYIFFAEWFHPNGTIHQIKKAFLIH